MDSLIKFIEETPNWRRALKEPPYNLRTVEHSTTHPNYWMFVYNLFDSDFEDEKIKACRGIILEIVGNKVIGVVSHAMDKFFNYGDPKCDSIDWTTAKVLSKKDGQLIKVSRYKGELIWCTNGAFGLHTPLTYTDDKIKDYQSLVNYAIGDKSWLDKIPEGMTIFMELCSRYNRIVCQYNEPKMWLLGARGIDQIEIMPEVIKEQLGCPLDYPESYDLHDMDAVIEKLKTFNWREDEGFVIRDANFHRIKIKCEDYIRIHLLIGDNGLTEDKIFEAILTDKIDDLIEIDNTVIKTIENIKQELKDLKEKLLQMGRGARDKYAKLNNNRKEFAKWAMSTDENTLWFTCLDVPIGELYPRIIEECKKHNNPYQYLKRFI